MWDYVGDAYAHRLNQAKVVAMHVNEVTILGIAEPAKLKLCTLASSMHLFRFIRMTDL